MGELQPRQDLIEPLSDRELEVLRLLATDLDGPEIASQLVVSLTPLAALLPHAQQRYAAVPVALALAWLGSALWSERRASAVQAVPATANAQLRPAAAK